MTRLLPACLLLMALCSHAADPTPRERVEAVARAIDTTYFDAQRAREIATDLRSDAASGEFDALRDPRDLAAALTARLARLDRHFAVRWAPTAAANGEQAVPQVDYAELSRRGNYGVRRVELLPGNIGYLDLREFAHFEFDDRDAPARRAVDAALEVLARSDAMIVDLRDNGGGSPAMVGYLASAFVRAGADVYNTFRSREGTESEAPRVPYARPRTDVPLFLLVSGRTGSAAEAFAYTLANAKRARVLGEPSAGAANPGGEVDVGHGLHVFVSDGSPVSPVTKTNWEGTGVVPHERVASEQALALAQRRALEAIRARGARTDVDWALEALAAQVEPPRVDPAPYAGEFGEAIVRVDGGALELRRARRPPWTLLPLARDRYTVLGEPARRVTFVRGADDAVVALEISFVDGPVVRFPKSR